MRRVGGPVGGENGRSGRTGPAGFLRTGRQSLPREYLLSRLRGRRSKLIRSWRTLLLEPSPEEHLASARYEGFARGRGSEGLWQALLQEHRWVYGQMDDPLRRDLAPYFLYAELRTVFIRLRGLQAGRPEDAVELLGTSLLSREIAGLLRTGTAAEAVSRLEARLRGLSPRFAGLAEQYAAKGLRQVERSMTDAYLGHVLSLPLPRPLHGLFMRLADARNILSLFKALRMGAAERPVFLAGGTIALERLYGALERGDPQAVLPLVRRSSGITPAGPEATAVETSLYRGVTRHLRAEARDPLGTAVVLDYLWRCSLEITNLGLLLAGKELERQELEAELVY